MIRKILLPLLLVLVSSAHGWQSDNNDGSYRNPPLNADYPDPDIIRVGEDFYFASTTFANTPGLTILHSKDLVNWEIVNHVLPRLDGRPHYDMQGGVAYRGGVYAPSLRYRKGTFFVAVTLNGQHTRIYYTNDIRGSWRYRELDRAAFDPGLFIEDDGSAYLVTSGGWDGTVTILTLDAELGKVLASRKVHFNKGAEGSKLIKRGGWYYLFNAIPGKLALTVSRASALFGPYETRTQIDDATGGHQGALVDLPNGSWYGFVMRDSGPVGRVTNISPIHWKNDWPVWGTEEAPGAVPSSAPKPILGKPVVQPGASDEFSSPSLALQWQWNHNSVGSKWSLTERPGFLRLRSSQAEELWSARNTLTQKGQAPWCRGDVRLDLSGLQQGDRCGFGTFGKICGDLVVSVDDDGRFELQAEVYVDGTGLERRGERVAVPGKEIYLRTEMDFEKSRGRCLYSFDNAVWTELGGEFELAYDWRKGTFQGQQFALFCYNTKGEGGWVDVDWFRFSDAR